jgi:hypothetical protein
MTDVRPPVPSTSHDLQVSTGRGGAVDEALAMYAYELAQDGQLDHACRVLEGLAEPCAWVGSWWTAAAGVHLGDARPVELLVDRLGEHDLVRAVVALAAGPAHGTYELGVALWERLGPLPELVAFLAAGSPRFGFPASIDAWRRLFEADALDSGDPLEYLLASDHGDVADRLLAALVLDDVVPVLPLRRITAAAATEDELIAPVLGAVHVFMPDHLLEVASTMATTVSRGRLVAAALDLIDPC